jgi:hypothetical protein
LPRAEFLTESYNRTVYQPSETQESFENEKKKSTKRDHKAKRKGDRSGRALIASTKEESMTNGQQEQQQKRNLNSLPYPTMKQSAGLKWSQNGQWRCRLRVAPSADIQRCFGSFPGMALSRIHRDNNKEQDEIKGSDANGTRGKIEE